MSKERSSSSDGIGFTSALFLVFLVLKLTNVIGWSWWWITAPLWGGIALVIVGFGVYVLFELVFNRAKEEESDGVVTRDVSKSKFMQKLEEAQAASEAKRQAMKNQNLN